MAFNKILEPYTAFLEYSQDLVICLSTDYSITDISRAALETYAWEKQAVLGQNYFDVLNREKLKPPILANTLTQISLERPLTVTEYIVLKNRREFCIAWTIIRLSDTPAEKTFFLLGRNNTVEVLQERSNKQPMAEDPFLDLKNIITCMPGSIYWKDRAGIYRGCNRGAANLFGYDSPEDIIGKSDLDFAQELNVSEFFLESVRSLDQEIMDLGMPRLNYEELPFPSASGEEVYQLSNKVPLQNEKKEVIGLIGISIDISSIKRAEQQLKLAKEQAEATNQAKSEFLSTISHELRIPLTGILGMAQLLDDASLSSEQREEYRLNILKSSNYLISLVNDILDFSKLEAGKVELHPSLVHLKSIINDTITMLAPQAKFKGLDLRVSYEDSIPNRLVADSRALKQILINLIGNAIKFTQKGYIAVKVFNVKQTANSVCLKFNIEDTGIGVPKEKFSVIFNRFEQVDSSNAHVYKSTGLGLSIVKKLIELMDGTITVESQVGEGSVFSCILEFPLQEKADFSMPWSKYEGKVKVLIVDDTARGNVICKRIGLANCEVIPGDQALNKLKLAQNLRSPFEILIIDNDLKTINSFELIKLIRNEDQLIKPMSLLLTNDQNLKRSKFIQDLGFYDILVKPMILAEFQNNLTTAWERWKEHQKKSDLAGKLSRILLVEDDKIIQIVHEQFLRELGYTVETADTGKKALELLTQKDFDSVVLDLSLPDITGSEVAIQVRKWEEMKKKKHIPIIALTGYTGDQYEKICLDAGINYIRVKPIAKQELSELLSFCARMESV